MHRYARTGLLSWGLFYIAASELSGAAVSNDPTAELVQGIVAMDLDLPGNILAPAAAVIAAEAILHTPWPAGHAVTLTRGRGVAEHPFHQIEISKIGPLQENIWFQLTIPALPQALVDLTPPRTIAPTCTDELAHTLVPNHPLSQSIRQALAGGISFVSDHRAQGLLRNEVVLVPRRGGRYAVYLYIPPQPLSLGQPQLLDLGEEWELHP